MPRAQQEHRPSNTKLGRSLWAAAGFVCFALGMIGVFLPILPTTPFILLAAICFAKSSKRINDWFKSTKVYRTVFENYVEKREMTVKAKLTILIPVTILLAIAAFFMRRILWGEIILAAVWLGHIIYFGFVVKTEN